MGRWGEASPTREPDREGEARGRQAQCAPQRSQDPGAQRERGRGKDGDDGGAAGALKESLRVLVFPFAFARLAISFLVCFRLL